MNNTYFSHPSSSIDPGAKIGSGTKIWHFCHVMGTAHVGQDCVLGQNVFVGDRVVIGDSCKIQNNVSLYEGVVCADRVFIGPSAVFTNVINPRAFIERKDEYQSTRIAEGASIGANATILCGIAIGAYAFIGAGAVVTCDVAPYSLMLGNPGKHAGWMSQAGGRLIFIDDQATCPIDGSQYHIIDYEVTKL